MKAFTLCVVASALVGVAVSSPGGFAFLANLNLPQTVLDAIDEDSVTKQCFASIEKAKVFTSDALTGKDHTSASCNDAKKLCSACHSCEYFNDGTVMIDTTQKSCICAVAGTPSFTLGPKDDCVVFPAHSLYAGVANTGAGDDCIISVHADNGAAIEGGSGDDVILILNDGQRDSTQLSLAEGGQGRDCIYLADDISLGVYGGADSDIIFVETNIGARGLSTGGAFAVVVDGGDGDDLIIDKNNLVANMIGIEGANGNDVIRVHGFAYNVSGGDGQDDIEILGGARVYRGVYGDQGNDRLVIDGGAYVQDLIGGKGNDYLFVYENARVDNSVYGDSGDDYIYVSKDVYAYYLGGGDGNDRIINLGYVRDDIEGGNGDDFIFHGSDAHVQDIYGSDGSDKIYVYGKVRYQIYGNNGDDYIVFSGYAESIQGDADDDTIVVNGGFLKYNVEGGEGEDKIILNSGNVYGAYGEGGDDEINVYSSAVVRYDVSGDGGQDRIYVDGNVGYGVYGDDGNDAIQIASSGNVGYYVSGNGGNDTIVVRGFVGMEVYGGADDDNIIIKSSANVLLVDGEAGIDYIKADVQVQGGIYGGAGVDTCVGGNNLDKDDIVCDNVDRTTVAPFPGRSVRTSNPVADISSSS